MTTPRSLLGSHFFSISSFFGVRIVTGFVMLALSAHQSSAHDFIVFSQFFIGFSLLNLLVSGSFQSGLVREAALAVGLGDATNERLQKVIVVGIIATGALGGLVFCLCTILQVQISQLLTGKNLYSSIVPAIAACSALTAIGQAACAILSGMGRVTLSLASQGAATIIATACSAWALLENNVVLAILLYGVGNSLLVLCAILIPSIKLSIRGLKATWSAEILKRLSQSSIAYVIAASAVPVTLFLLRPHYLHSFGESGLVAWLTANRISDFVSQFTGIYMGQIYLPKLIKLNNKHSEGRLVFQSIIVLVPIMAMSAAFFAISGNFILLNFVSEKMVFAKDFILFYLIGDIARIFTSMVFFTAIARGSFFVGAYFEVMNSILFALIFCVFMNFGVSHAPAFSYIMSNLFVGIFGLYFFVFKKYRIFENK